MGNTIIQTNRPIYKIAQEIMLIWPNVYFGAKPYLIAMLALTDINSKYGMDSSESIISYFLSNSSSFRGPEAKKLKNELKTIIK